MGNRKPSRHSALPPTLDPRGLSRVEAAAYIGVSAGKFDDMVADGRMPKPIEIDVQRIWDIRAIDRAFDDLAGKAEESERDEVLAKSRKPKVGRVDDVREPPAVFSPETLGEWWSCSPQHIRDLCKSGELRSFRAGTMIRISAETVDEFERAGGGKL